MHYMFSPDLFLHSLEFLLYQHLFYQVWIVSHLIQTIYYLVGTVFYLVWTILVCTKPVHSNSIKGPFITTKIALIQNVVQSLCKVVLAAHLPSLIQSWESLWHFAYGCNSDQSVLAGRGIAINSTFVVVACG